MFELTNTNDALYKHLRAHIGYLERYGKWACIHKFEDHSVNIVALARFEI